MGFLGEHVRPLTCVPNLCVFILFGGGHRSPITSGTSFLTSGSHKPLKPLENARAAAGPLHGKHTHTILQTISERSGNPLTHLSF